MLSHNWEPPGFSSAVVAHLSSHLMQVPRVHFFLSRYRSSVDRGIVWKKQTNFRLRLPVLLFYTLAPSFPHSLYRFLRCIFRYCASRSSLKPDIIRASQYKDFYLPAFDLELKRILHYELTYYYIIAHLSTCVVGTIYDAPKKRSINLRPIGGRLA